MRVGGRGGDGENQSFVVDGVLVVVALVGSEQAGRRGFVVWQVAPGRRSSRGILWYGSRACKKRSA